MKTSVMEVHDMLSVLSVLGVEQKIGAVAGVESVTVNYAAGNATVRYDETRLDIADIRSGVRQIVNDATADAPAPAGPAHETMAMPGASPAPPASPALAASPALPASPALAASPARAASRAAPATAPPAAAGVPVAVPAGAAAADPADPAEHMHDSSAPKKDSTST